MYTNPRKREIKDIIVTDGVTTHSLSWGYGEDSPLTKDGLLDPAKLCNGTYPQISDNVVFDDQESAKEAYGSWEERDEVLRPVVEGKFAGVVYYDMHCTDPRYLTDDEVAHGVEMLECGTDDVWIIWADEEE